MSLHKYKSWFQLSRCCLLSVWAPRGQWSVDWPKTLSSSQLLAEWCKTCWYEPIRLPTWTVGWSQEELTALSLFTKRSAEEGGYIFQTLCVGNAAISYIEEGLTRHLWPPLTSPSCASAAVTLLHPTHSDDWCQQCENVYFWNWKASLKQEPVPALCLCLLLYIKGTWVVFQPVSSKSPSSRRFSKKLRYTVFWPSLGCLEHTAHILQMDSGKEENAEGVVWKVSVFGDNLSPLEATAAAWIPADHQHFQDSQIFINIRFIAEELVYWLSCVKCPGITF